MKNDLTKRREAEKKLLLDIGQDIGFQKALDYMQLGLRDSTVVKDDKWGAERISRLLTSIQRNDKYYSDAYTLKKEADYLQAKLDAELREIWGDDLAEFSERQPYIKQTEYDKPRKGWKK